MTSLKVVPFPEHFAAMNIPEALRTLAIEIEDGPPWRMPLAAVGDRHGLW